MMKQARSSNRVLCLRLPNWPVQRLQLVRPELKGQGLVLYEQYRTGCYRVVACAGKHGIAPGMSLVEARTIAAVHCEAHDPTADDEALWRLALECDVFSPVVGIEAPDHLVLDVGGSATLFGGEDSLVKQVHSDFRQRGLTIRVALADTLGAAWAVANYSRESTVVVATSRTAAALADLPVAALRLSSECVATLNELGIEKIEQLTAIPRGALQKRFGSEILRRLDQAMGMVPEPIVSHRPPAEITAETHLEYPLVDLSSLETILTRLMDRIAGALAECQQGAIQIECELQCESSQAVSFFVELFQASVHAKHLHELSRMQLERLRLPGPVSSLKLSVLTSAPLQARQQELFESSCSEDRRQVGLLVDRLSNRLGREAVVRALPQSEAQPELAFRFQPLAGLRLRKASQRWKQAPRPTLLEVEPLPLHVVAVVPNGPPMQFEHHGRHRVAHAWGPERIQTGWWRGRYVQRDYYRVETVEGKRFWIFRRLHDAKWFLHGAFD